MAICASQILAGVITIFEATSGPTFTSQKIGTICSTPIVFYLHVLDKGWLFSFRLEKPVIPHALLPTTTPPSIILLNLAYPCSSNQQSSRERRTGRLFQLVDFAVQRFSWSRSARRSSRSSCTTDFSPGFNQRSEEHTS